MIANVAWLYRTPQEFVGRWEFNKHHHWGLWGQGIWVQFRVRDDRGSSLMRPHPAVEPYDRHMPRALRWTKVGGAFLMRGSPVGIKFYLSSEFPEARGFWEQR